MTGYPATVGELRALIGELPDEMPLRSDDGNEICTVIVGVADGKFFVSPGNGVEDNEVPG